MSSLVLGAQSYAETPDVNGVPLALSTDAILLQALTSVVAAATGTSTIPFANTTPLVTAGTQVWSQAITPHATTSRINVRGAFLYDCGTTGRTLVVCLFRGSVCIGVTEALLSTATRAIPISFNFTDSPAAITAQTYSIRVGLNANGTWYVNQTATPYFNGLMALNGITVSEFA
jgi:hypothetical protein